MIATEGASHWLLRLIAPLVWRNDVKIASKLHGFAATEDRVVERYGHPTHETRYERTV